MKYRINWGDDVFAVPRSAADGLKLASPKAAKVLMWLCANKCLPDDPSEIDRNISRDDVEDALNFWTQLGVVTDKDRCEPAPVPSPKKASPPRFKMLMPTEIAERVQGSPDIRFLFESTEQYAARPLTHDEQRTLIWIHDHLGIPSDVILMLVSRCFSAGKGQMSYIEKVACDWSERGIFTYADAERELIEIQRRDSGRDHIMKLIGAARLSSAQTECVDRWNDWNVTDEMINHAAEICTDKKMRIDIKYMDGIICKWRKDGINTVDGAKRMSEERRKPAEKGRPQKTIYDTDMLAMQNFTGFLDGGADN
ncbi:MAG: DnaD domain protein [Oscillospiraceae bacterium]|nr:DnaD domain protein [Oscillospiraceae bacterium]